MGKVNFLQDFLVYGFQQDLTKLKKKFHVFSLVPTPIQEGQKEFGLIVIGVFPPTADESHESAIQLDWILILPQLDRQTHT